jgi:hypothetical protein
MANPQVHLRITEVDRRDDPKVGHGQLLRFAGSLGGSVLLLGGALLVAALAVAAAGSTFYVSPTGMSGGAGTSCTTAAYVKINDAVSAASAGNTVIVCAGT